MTDAWTQSRDCWKSLLPLKSNSTALCQTDDIRKGQTVQRKAAEFHLRLAPIQQYDSNAAKAGMARPPAVSSHLKTVRGISSSICSTSQIVLATQSTRHQSLQFSLSMHNSISAPIELGPPDRHWWRGTISRRHHALLSTQNCVFVKFIKFIITKNLNAMGFSWPLIYSELHI